jgi:hypothetical protein
MSFLQDIFGGLSNNYNPNPNNVQVQSQNLQPAINTANTNYGSANTGLANFAQALQQQMSGQGPNIANAQLQQGTNQNIQQGAGLIASQKGIGPATAARTIATNTNAANQGAAGQAAATRLAGQTQAGEQLGGALNTQGNLANQNLGIQQNALAAQNNTAANLAGIQAGIAQQNAGMNQGLLGGLAGSLMGTTTTGAGGSQTSTPGLLSLFMAKGGQADRNSNASGPFGNVSGFNGSGSNFGFGNVNTSNFLSGLMPKTEPVQIDPSQANKPGGGLGSLIMNAPGGKTGLAMASAGGGSIGETPMPVLPFGPQTMAPMGAHGLAGGGPIDGDMYAAHGMPVPGQAAVPGDSLKNDKIPAMLSPKEIILPRSITLSDDAPKKAAEFVANIKAKHGAPKEDFRGALDRSIASRRKK